MTGLSSNVCAGCFGQSGGRALCGECVGLDRDEDGLPIGTLLKYDAYQLGIMLGRGGFGITYLAWDFPNRRRVAVKEYFPKDFGKRLPDGKTVRYRAATLADPFQDGLQKFIEEGRKLWDLRLPNAEKHPYIVEVYESFPEHETAYIVMEYLGSLTLEEWLTRQPQGTTSYEQIRKILNPVIDGLHFIHEHNLYHRDVSPDNMCITTNGGIKLIDFGAAKFAVREADPSKTHSITIRDGYSPYEQYASTGYGPWTDVYALSATFYRALTGTPPPLATDRQFEVTEGRGDPLQRLNDVVPPAAAVAIHKALSIAARDRYKSVREFQADMPGTAPARVNQESHIAQNLPVSPVPGPTEDSWIPQQEHSNWRFGTVLFLIFFIVSSVACFIAAFRASPDWITVALWSLLGLALACWARWLIGRKARSA